MKTSIGLFIIFLAGFGAYAQSKPETYISDMPVITNSVCNKESRDQFLDDVTHLKNELIEEIARRKNAAKQNIKGMDEQAAKNMMSQMGYSVSDADIQKMKNASKEEKKAMADKMLQQNMNMSMDEVQRVSKMSDAGKQAWSEGMTTELMADAQANPDKYKTSQTFSMGMYEMTMEQSQLAQKIQAGIMKFEEKLAEFNKIKEEAFLEYNKCCDDIDKRYADMVNHTLGDEYAEPKRLEKESCYQNYCGFLIPKYKTLMDERYRDIVASGDDYNRIDVLSNELSSATTGSKNATFEPGLTYLEALKDYMMHLTDLP
jgi:hypothetical protein